MPKSYSRRIGDYALLSIDTDTIEINGQTYLWITRLYTPPSYRGQGHMRNAIQRLLNDLDWEGMDCVLEVAPEPGYEWVAEWYQRLGFRPWRGTFWLHEHKQSNASWMPGRILT